VAKRTQNERDYARHGQWVIDVLTPVCDAIGAGKDPREEARKIAAWWLGDDSLTWIDLMNKLGI
jgi:hypothetical protein